MNTRYGLHDSAGCHSRPEDPKNYYKNLMDKYGFSWYKLLCAGRNKVDLASILVNLGFNVICRLYKDRPHHKFVVNYDDIKAYVDVGVKLFEWGNEPNLVIECEDTPSPKACAEQHIRNYEVISSAGGIALTPALSPGGNYPHRQYFVEFLNHLNALDSLHTVTHIAIHNRPLNHPCDYTDDSGVHFLDYEWYGDVTRAYFGKPLPLYATEAGYTIGDNHDNRYPEITKELHSQYNLEIIDGFRTKRWKDYLKCQCFWIGEGFDHMTFLEAWWFNNVKFGGNLPIVNDLEQYWNQHKFDIEMSEQEIAEYLQQFVIPQNLDSAFYKYSKAKGRRWTSMSREIDFNGRRYQVFLSEDGKTQHIVNAPINRWELTTHFDYPNER